MEAGTDSDDQVETENDDVLADTMDFDQGVDLIEPTSNPVDVEPTSDLSIAPQEGLLVAPSEQAVPEHVQSLGDSIQLAPVSDAENAEGASDDQAVDRGVSSTAMAAVDGLSVGGWVELKQDSGAIARCKLAVRMAHNGQLIFVNRSGVKMAEYTGLELAVDIDRGKVTVIESGEQFERTLETLVKNAREE